MEQLDELYYILKDRYSKSQLIEDSDLREVEEGKIYDELVEFISNKYDEIYQELDDIYYDEDLMDIFATSDDERNFIERVIKEYPINIRNLIDEDYVIKWYINNNI